MAINSFQILTSKKKKEDEEKRKEKKKKKSYLNVCIHYVKKINNKRNMYRWL